MTTKTVSDPLLHKHLSQIQTLYDKFKIDQRAGNFTAVMLDMEQRTTLATQYPEAWAAFEAQANRNPDGSPLAI